MIRVECMFDAQRKAQDEQSESGFMECTIHDCANLYMGFKRLSTALMLGPGGLALRGSSFPRHQGRMDHIRLALATDGFDREIHIL